MASEPSASKNDIKDEAGNSFEIDFWIDIISYFFKFEEIIIAQIQKKLSEAFEVFDGDKTKTCDAKY